MSKVHNLVAADLVLGADKPKRQRKAKPRIDAMIKQAERTGKQVTSITTPDGVTLTFGQPESNTTNTKNPWDTVYDTNKIRPS
jgi:hypothetical protein